MCLLEDADLDGPFSGKAAGAKGLLKEAGDFLERLKAKENREKAVDKGKYVCL